VVRGVPPIERMTRQEIDTAVSERLRDGLSLNHVDEALLRDIAPHLIVTQDLCQVCAVSGNEVVRRSRCSERRAFFGSRRSRLNRYSTICANWGATDRGPQAEAAIMSGRATLEKVAAVTRTIPCKSRVFCMEWTEPVCCEYSVRIAWEDVLRWVPEVLIVMPRGFDLPNTMERTNGHCSYPGWSELPVVKADSVNAENANAHFAQPGPRVVDGNELLAHLIHPGHFDWSATEQCVTATGDRA
jgi:iron complex transport system substrate-binding protein